MLTIHYIVGGVFAVVGIYRAWAMKDFHSDSFPLTPKIVYGFAVSILWTLLGVLLMFAQIMSGIVKLCILFALLVLFVLVILTKGLIRGMDDRESYSVPHYAKEVARDVSVSFKSKVKELYRIIAPDGWRELSLDVRSIENVMTFGVMVKIYFLLVLVGLIAVPVVLAWSFLNSGIEQRRVIGVVGAYNLLLSASSLTVSFLLVVLLSIVLFLVGVLKTRIRIRYSIEKISAITGYFTVIGFASAALIPVVAALTPSVKLRAPSDFEFVSLDLLVNFTAIGAIFGYVFGLLTCFSELAVSAQNLVVRRLFVPLLAIIVLCITVRMKISPHGIASRIMETFSGDGNASCLIGDDSRIMEISDMELFQFFEQCSVEQVVITDPTYLWCSVVGVVGFAVVSLKRDIRSARDVSCGVSARPTN